MNEPALLRAIAEEVDRLGDDLLDVAEAETNLTRSRLTGERDRTTGQLRRLAAYVEVGCHLDATIDHATPDVRRMGVPIGTVAVFAAGNFPLAFSVAGGDSASALAAGCPVVLKAHPGHPRTSDLRAALARCGIAVAPGTPTDLAVDRAELRPRPELREAVFGPHTVLVRCADDEEFLAAAGEIEGSLTATVHAGVGDDSLGGALLEALRLRAGRIVWGGWPTGVAVTAAMHHGGPYPATTAPLTTSVGDAAVRRFLRPVCFQGVPDALLPPALQEANPLGFERLVDGRWTNSTPEST